MTKKLPKPFRMSPLQKYTTRPLSPAEQVALDEKNRQAEERMAASQVVELAAQLSAKRRFPVTVQVVDQLSADERLQLAEHLIARLPPAALQRLQEQLPRRPRKRSG
jgi:hypothetical protein